LLTSTSLKWKSRRKTSFLPDLAIEKGTASILLGAKESGHRHVIDCILGLGSLKEGEVIVCGEKWTPKTNRNIGCALRPRVFIDHLTIKDNLQSHRRLSSFEEKDIDEVLEEFGLAENSGARVYSLSDSMKQRLNLARAAMGSPQLLVLEDPFSDLDEIWRKKLHAWIEKSLGNGVGILMSTHQPEDVQKFGNDIIIFDKGKVIERGDGRLLDPNVKRIAIRCDSAISTATLMQKEPEVINATVHSPDYLTIHILDKNVEWVRNTLKKGNQTYSSCQNIPSNLERLFPPQRYENADK